MFPHGYAQCLLLTCSPVSRPGLASHSALHPQIPLALSSHGRIPSATCTLFKEHQITKPFQIHFRNSVSRSSDVPSGRAWLALVRTPTFSASWLPSDLGTGQRSVTSQGGPRNLRLTGRFRVSAEIKPSLETFLPQNLSSSALSSSSSWFQLGEKRLRRWENGQEHQR